MVAKIVKGQNFKGAIDYITDIYGKDKQKKGARLIYHSSGIPPANFALRVPSISVLRYR